MYDVSQRSYRIALPNISRHLVAGKERFPEEGIRCNGFYASWSHVYAFFFSSIEITPRPGGNVTDFLHN